MHVIVVGAGIGGMTAALALRQRGIGVEVYERSAALADVGAGISLWANALKALHQLGLKAPLDARSFSSEEGALRTVDGAVLSSTSSHEIIARFGMPVAVFHRAELLEVLHDAARDIPIHLDHECRAVDTGPGQVTVGFTGGTAGAGGRRRRRGRAPLGGARRPGDSRRDSLRRLHRVARHRPFPDRRTTRRARRWDAASASGWSRSPATASIGTRPTTCPKEGVRIPNPRRRAWPACSPTGTRRFRR